MAALGDAMKQGIWFDQARVEEAEYNYQMFLAHGKPIVQQSNVNKSKSDGGSKNQKVVQSKSNKKEAGNNSASGGLAKQIADARQKIKDSITSYNPSETSSQPGDSSDLSAEVEKLRLENEKLQKVVADMTSRFAALESRLSALEGGAAPAAKPQAAPAAAAPAKKPAPADDSDDDDDDEDDLFGSDDEDDEEAERIKQERLKAYAEKKAKKPGPIAKSNIILDVKPRDDETDMQEVERLVRTIECDGLVWGASKFAKVAYGITKLQITCVVEDDKVGTDFLEEKITGFDDYVQSMDIVAFNKI